jgi:hypothetical protein
MNTIDSLLANYEPGKPENKPEVLRQIEELKQKRMEAIENHQKQQLQQQFQLQNQNQNQNQNQKNIMNANPIELATAYEKKLSEQTQIIHSLLQENAQLKSKNDYLEKKITDIITKTINQKFQKQDA